MEFPHLIHPFTLLIAGPSGSGKSFLVKRIIDERLIKPFPKQIIWCYGAYQDLFNRMSGIQFCEGLPSNIDQITDALVIIDDLMCELGGDNRLSKLFTKGSHHRNISVIFIVQNLFYQGSQMRNISLNASYICCFKNVRDKQQINCLARQMYPDKVKFFQESYNDATSAPYGYLFLDLKPETDERLRIRTNIFPKDEKNIIYLPKDYPCDFPQDLPKNNPSSSEEKCPECSTTFTCKRSLTRHLKAKHNEKTHSCHLCGKTFSRKYVLNNHLKVIHQEATGPTPSH